jgi:hypothetical protein
MAFVGAASFQPKQAALLSGSTVNAPGAPSMGNTGCHQGRLPSFSPRPADARLVPVRLRRQLFQVHRSHLWMGTQPHVLHSPHGASGHRVEAAVPRPGLSGRLSHLPGQSRKNRKHERLPTGYANRRQAFDLARPGQAPDKGRMEWKYSSGAPWLRNRYGEQEVLHRAEEDGEGTRPGPRYPPTGQERQEVGVKRPVAFFLWCMCVTFLGDALRAILHQEFVRRPHPQIHAQTGVQEREPLSDELPGNKGSENVDATRDGSAEGRPIRPLGANGIMHTDAADVGFGGNMTLTGNTGDPRTLHDQGIWRWTDRTECISVRELKAIRICYWASWESE